MAVGASGADSALAGGAAVAEPRPGSRFAALYVFVLVATCLFLQRFGIPLGEFKLHLATLAAFALVGAGLALRQVSVNVSALVVYFAFAAAALLTGIISTELGSDATLRRSMPSLYYFVGLYAPFVFRARRPIPPIDVFRIVQNCLIVVAWAGIAQFALQFVGLPLFSFRELVPAEFLMEEGYNIFNAAGPGSSIFKSNGLFLLEASLLSQVMAIAIMLEVLYFKRVLALVLFGVALFTALSGTGLMVLIVFFVMFALGGQSRRATDLLLVGVFVAVFYVLVTSVFTELGGYLVGRQGEFFAEGSSAYLRFITPFQALAEIFNRYPSFIMVGLGPGSAEALRLGFDYNIMTPIKIAIEYGVIVLALWVGLLLIACSRREWRTLFWPTLFLFFFTGGYQQLGPIIFLLHALFAFAASRGDRTA